jgi:hypothetical protein
MKDFSFLMGWEGYFRSFANAIRSPTAILYGAVVGFGAAVVYLIGPMILFAGTHPF